MRKFVLIIACLALFMGLKLVSGPAVHAFDFLKSVEKAARSVEKTLDDTFDKKKPGSDESLEQNLEKQKQADEKPEIAKQNKADKDESVVDGVKEQGADMYKTVKGVFVSDDKEPPDASIVKEAAQAPTDTAKPQAKRPARQTKRASATPAKAAAQSEPKEGSTGTAPRKVTRTSSPKTEKSASTSRGTDRDVKKAKHRRSRTAGGNAMKHGHQVVSEGSWDSCSNKQETIVTGPGMGDGTRMEIHCMATFDITARSTGMIDRSADLILRDANYMLPVEEIPVMTTGRPQSFKVRSGTFLVELKHRDTREIKRFGLVEIKPDSKHRIGVEFKGAHVKLRIKDVSGKIVGGEIQTNDVSTSKRNHHTGEFTHFKSTLYPGHFIFIISNDYVTNKQFSLEVELKPNQQTTFDVVLTTGEKPPKRGSTEIKKWREIDWLVPAGGGATKVVPEKSVKEQVGKVVILTGVNRAIPPRIRVRFKDPDSGKTIEEFEQFAELSPKGRYVKAGKYRLEIEGIDSGRKLDLGVVQIKPGEEFKRDLKLKYTEVIVSVRDRNDIINQVWLDFKDPASGKVIRKISGFPKFKTYVYPAKYSMELRRTPKDATPMAVVAVDARQGGEVIANVDLSNVKAASGGAPAKPVQVKAEANPCGNRKKGMFGCYQLHVKDADGNPIEKYTVEYKSLTGGSGGTHKGARQFSLEPGKTQLVLYCQGHKKVMVLDVKPDQLIEREIIFPAVYKGKVNVAGSTTDGGFCVIDFYLYDPETKKKMFSWSINGRSQSDYAHTVTTGKYHLVAEHKKTKQKKDLGIIVVKKGQTAKKSVVFKRGTLSLTIYGDSGKIISAKATIYDAKTNKVVRRGYNGDEPLVMQFAPGDYIAKVSKYSGNENVPVKFTIKDKDATVKEVTIPN